MSRQKFDRDGTDPATAQTMPGPTSIEGYAIVSADGMLAIRTKGA